MRNWKKFLSAAMVTAMTVGMLAGCGSGNSGSDSNSSGSNSGSESSSDAGSTSDSGSGDAVLKIGGIGPTTGGAAIYGEAVKNGAELAVKEINADGGINGIQIEFNFQDDENDAEKAVNAYNTLKDWGMQALLGTVTSAPCVAVGDVAQGDNMFLLTPSEIGRAHV